MIASQASFHCGNKLENLWWEAQCVSCWSFSHVRKGFSDTPAPLPVLLFQSLSNARPRCQAGLVQLLRACQHLSRWLQRLSQVFWFVLVWGERQAHTVLRAWWLSAQDLKTFVHQLGCQKSPPQAHLFWEGGRHTASFTAEANQPFSKVTSRQERDVPAAKRSMPAPRGHRAKKGKQISGESTKLQIQV